MWNPQITIIGTQSIRHPNVVPPLTQGTFTKVRYRNFFSEEKHKPHHVKWLLYFKLMLRYQYLDKFGKTLCQQNGCCHIIWRCVRGFTYSCRVAFYLLKTRHFYFSIKYMYYFFNKFLTLRSWNCDTTSPNIGGRQKLSQT